MIDIQQKEAAWMKWLRIAAGVGLFAYLASFFLLSSIQKPLFYILVGAPGIILCRRLGQLLRSEHRPSVSLVLIFVTYFATSSLWSDDGQFVTGAKLALGIVCLMLAIQSTLGMWPESGALVQRFVLTIGSVLACAACASLLWNALVSGQYAGVLSTRYSLQLLMRTGDSNPINTAIYLGVVALTAWWMFPQSRLPMKFGLLLTMGASIVVMFLTQSRGPLLSLTVVLLTMSILRRHRDDLRLWGFVAILLAASIAGTDLLRSVIKRAGSPNYRIEIWTQAIGIIKEHLLFGQGLGQSADIPFMSADSVVVVSHSHSSILETFRVGGLVGGTIFLAMTLAALRPDVRKGIEQRYFVYWLLFGLLCLSTNGRLPMIRPSIEWFAFWIPLFFVFFTPKGVNGTTSTAPPTARPAQ